jgi:hypothetical protein
VHVLLVQLQRHFLSIQLLLQILSITQIMHVGGKATIEQWLLGDMKKHLPPGYSIAYWIEHQQHGMLH